MSDQESCFICETMHEAAPHDPRFVHQKCPRCGEFKMTVEAYTIIKNRTAADSVKISGWVSDQNRSGTVPIISGAVLKNVLARPLPAFVERANILLLEALRGKDRLGAKFDINRPKLIAATYSQDASEVDFLNRLLSERGFTESLNFGGHCKVLPSGYIAADKLTRQAQPSDKGFVAMSFDVALKPAYENGFQIGIINAGYDPVRVDRVEHTNRIDDEIIAHIRAASFVVTDFTGHRGGVYFEAGFALGLNLPVIWTCQKDDMKDLHFDIRQYNTIDWETPEDLALRLQRRIEATVGKGPRAVLDS